MKLFALEDGIAELLIPETSEETILEIQDTAEEANRVSNEADIVFENFNALVQMFEIGIFTKQHVLNPISVNALRIAIESICSNVGINGRIDQFYAIETFQSPTSVLAATKIATEGLADKLKDFWIKIKDMIIAIINKIYMSWVSITKTFTRKLNSLQDLEKVANKLVGTPKEKELIASSKYINAFNSGNIDVNVFLKTIHNHVELCDFSFNISGFFKSISIENIKKLPTEEKKFELAFGKTLAYTIVNEKEDGSSNMFAKVDIIDREDVKVEAAMLKTLSKSEIKLLISNCKTLIEKTSKINKTLDDIKNSIVKETTAIDQAISKKTDSDSEANVSELENNKDTLTMFKNSISTISKLLTPNIYSNNIKLVDLAEDYIKLSMKAYR